MKPIKKLFRKRIDIYAPFGIFLIFVPVNLIWRIPKEIIPALYIAGIGLVAIGALFRFWSARYCGKKLTHSGTKKFVTTGPYSVFRNPLYVANITITLGFILFAHFWFLAPFFLIYSLIRYTMIVKREEHSLESAFGDEYREYKRNVRRWLPNPIRFFRIKNEPLYGWGKVIKREAPHTIIASIALVFLFFKNILLDVFVRFL